MGSVLPAATPVPLRESAISGVGAAAAVPVMIQFVGFSSLSLVPNNLTQLQTPAAIGVTVTARVVVPLAATDAAGVVVNVAVQLTGAEIVGVPTVSAAVPMLAIW